MQEAVVRGVRSLTQKPPFIGNHSGGDEESDAEAGRLKEHLPNFLIVFNFLNEP